MKKTLLALSLLAASSFAMAQTPGFYIGANVGQSVADLDCAGTTSCDDSDTSVKAFLGYQINKTFAVEASYFDLGEPNATVGTARVRLKNTGFGLRGLASFPFSQNFSGFVGLGINQVKSDATVTMGTLTGSVDESSTQATVALGVDYALTPALKLRGEVEHYRFEAVGNSNFNVLNYSVGLKYQF